MKIENPTKRVTEVIYLFIENPKKWFSHYDFAKNLNNINSHKAIESGKKNGIKFKSKQVKFTNRFGRGSDYKVFCLDMTPSKAVIAYNKMNESRSKK